MIFREYHAGLAERRFTEMKERISQQFPFFTLRLSVSARVLFLSTRNCSMDSNSLFQVSSFILHGNLLRVPRAFELGRAHAVRP